METNHQAPVLLLCNGRWKHVTLFNTWCDSNNIHFNPEEALQDEATFPSVSSTPIPYPLPCSLQSLHDKHESGKVGISFSADTTCNWATNMWAWTPIQPRWSCFEWVDPTPPKMIIYDNGCKLHQYALNREPVHFKNTVFLVDRFHWRGHMGCSSGYSLDGYTSLNVASINSQVNKQTNAGLQRIKGHIAYSLH